MKVFLFGLCAVLLCTGCASSGKDPQTVRADYQPSSSFFVMRPSVEMRPDGVVVSGYLRPSAVASRFVQHAHMHVTVFDSHKAVVGATAVNVSGLPMRQTRFAPNTQFYSAHLPSVPPKDGAVRLILHENSVVDCDAKNGS